MRADLTTGEGDVWRRACEAMRALLVGEIASMARFPELNPGTALFLESMVITFEVMPAPDPPPDVLATGWDYRG